MRFRSSAGRSRSPGSEGLLLAVVSWTVVLSAISAASALNLCRVCGGSVRHFEDDCTTDRAGMLSNSLAVSLRVTEVESILLRLLFLADGPEERSEEI